VFGDIVTPAGRFIGHHDGVTRYTIGQRHGLGIGGGKPYFVAAKDQEHHRIIVAEGADDPSLYGRGLVATPFMVSDSMRDPSLRYTASIRYRHAPVPCSVQLDPLSQKMRIWFHAPQRAISPGQYVVVYNYEEIVGCGTIEHQLYEPHRPVDNLL
jgi:tRNA-specific 2-thiouridylase